MSGPSTLRASLSLALRSLLWVILLPGLVALVVPWTFFGLGQVRPDPSQPLHLIGLLAVGAGGVLFGACVWEFAREGRGTLSPADPPKVLVVRGLYRYVRNPMYLSVTLVLLGEALLAGSAALLAYWAIWFLGVNVFVLWYEEPILRRRFGASYESYTRRIRRWLPRLRERE